MRAQSRLAEPEAARTAPGPAVHARATRGLWPRGPILECHPLSSNPFTDSLCHWDGGQAAKASATLKPRPRLCRPRRDAGGLKVRTPHGAPPRAARRQSTALRQEGKL